MRYLLTIFLLLINLSLCCKSTSAASDFSKVPGTVIDYSPASSGIYLGSPSIAVFPNGDYIVSHDEFGPKSTEHSQAVSQIFRSTDRGQSWTKIATIRGAFWSTLFVHRNALYLLGTDKHHGNPVIRRSTDSGKTWTEPTSGATGLLRDNNQYACGPMPVIEHDGRLWRAIEWRNPPRGWGTNYQAGMMSIPVDADLLNAANWTFSNFLPSMRSWNGADMTAWLEGNAVVAPNGELVNVLRVQTSSPDEKAAIVHIGPDGQKASFDPAKDFVVFPGGAKKFAIRFDPQSKLYWSLATIVPERHRGTSPGNIRNTLALTCSPDLIQWTVRCILLYNPDQSKHGFQYVDWLFEGDDIIAVCRTSNDDGLGGAHNFHDSNFITFHRVANFRGLTPADSVPMPEPTKVSYDTRNFVISGYGFELARLAEGERAYSNRAYVWRKVSAAAGGLITRIAGGVAAQISVKAKRDTTLCIATALSQPGVNLEGWNRTQESFQLSDRNKTIMTVFTRRLQSGAEIVIPQGNWAGGLVLVPGEALSAP